MQLFLLVHTMASITEFVTTVFLILGRNRNSTPIPQVKRKKDGKKKEDGKAKAGDRPAPPIRPAPQ